MYNHHIISCYITGCLRAATSAPPPDPAGLGEQGRDQQSVHDEVEQVEDCRLRRRLETRRATSTTWLSRNHRSLDRGATRDEEGVLDDVVEQEPRDPERGGA